MSNRGKFIIDKETGELVPYQEERRARTHFVHTDEMDPLESMVTGRIHTSKSSLRAEYRQHGVIEKGNDHNTSKRTHWSEEREYQERLAADAERTWYAVRDGMAPLTELDRERCKIIDHNLKHYNFDNRERDENGNIRE